LVAQESKPKVSKRAEVPQDHRGRLRRLSRI
jgi:hypothetical protein